MIIVRDMSSRATCELFALKMLHNLPVRKLLFIRKDN